MIARVAAWLMNSGPVLAQTGRTTGGGVTPTDWLRLMGWIGAIIGVMVAGLAVMMYLKKRVTQGESERSTSSGLLDHLRELKRDGKITEEEFQAAKAKIAEKLKGGEKS